MSYRPIDVIAVQLSSCHRDHMASKAENIYYLALCINACQSLTLTDQLVWDNVSKSATMPTVAPDTFPVQHTLYVYYLC